MYTATELAAPFDVYTDVILVQYGLVIGDGAVAKSQLNPLKPKELPIPALFSRALKINGRTWFVSDATIIVNAIARILPIK